jgi:hypothetical protein
MSLTQLMKILSALKTLNATAGLWMAPTQLKRMQTKLAQLLLKQMFTVLPP